MTLPNLAAQIVSVVRASQQDSAINVENVVARLIREATPLIQLEAIKRGMTLAAAEGVKLNHRVAANSVRTQCNIVVAILTRRDSLTAEDLKGGD